MDLRLRVDESQIGRIRREFAAMPEKGRRALSAALNQTIRGVRTDTVRVIIREYHVKAGDVRATMTIRKATTNSLSAMLRSEGVTIRLIKFRVSPRSVGGRRPKVGVRVAVKRGAGSKRLPGSFIAAMSNASVGVFVRTGKDRLPIKQLRGPAVPSMVGGDAVWAALRTMAEQRLDKNIDHEIDRMLKGYGT